jgi:heme/copper-type cytochrome/quinol oxidase subunit 2
MSRNGRIALVAAALVVAVAAFVVLQSSGGDDGEEEASTTTEQTSTGETQTVTENAPATPATQRIAVRGGQPVGGVAKVTVTRGDTVRLIVSSPDTSAEVHLHGYDLSRDMAPGRPAAFKFKAQNEGAYEIELEDTHTQIATLEVRPS